MESYDVSFRGVVCASLNPNTLQYLTSKGCTSFDALYQFVCTVHASASAAGEPRADVFSRTMRQMVLVDYPHMPQDALDHDCRLLFLYAISALAKGDAVDITWKENGSNKHATYSSRIVELGGQPYTFIVECDGHDDQWHFDATIDAWSSSGIRVAAWNVE